MAYIAKRRLKANEPSSQIYALADNIVCIHLGPKNCA